MTRPTKNCYWVVDGKFLAGEYPRDISEDSSKLRIKALLNAGIDCFINLTEEIEHLERYDYLVENLSDNKEIILKRFPIRDVSVSKSMEYTSEILDFIDDQLTLNHKIYIHCMGGIGRTGTIVGCWLSRHGYKGEKALGKLKELWVHNEKSEWCNSPETPTQENYIIHWSE